MKTMGMVFGDVLRPGARGQVSCSDLQFFPWYRALGSEEKIETVAVKIPVRADLRAPRQIV